MSIPLGILLILSITSVVTFTAGQRQKAAVDCSECDPYALCDGLHCSCKAGFFGNGFSCSEIDECADSRTHNCSVGTCENTVGSYICLCPRDYIHSHGSCVLITECDDPRLHGCHPLAKCISNMYWYYCVCPDGYYGDGHFCEIDECQRGVCGFGMDCAKSLGSYYCYDPCVTHTVRNDPWRSTNYTLSPNCDLYMNGWYQFVGSGGVRIPEYCVPEYRCGSRGPVWMNGTHPVIRDGIVNRISCTHWAGDCCLLTSTFQVKACPQGYYVYKIIESPSCSSAYCTDPSTHTCKADEEWQLRYNQSGCFCKDPYKVTALSQVVPDLTCKAFDMKATFHKCQFNDLSIFFNKTHVKDNICYNFMDDLATNTFSILVPLKVGGCGVQSYEISDTHVTYKANIIIDVEEPGAIIPKKNTLNITRQCVYELDMISSLNIALHPIISSINITVPGMGQFQVYMALYKDINCTAPHTGPDVTLSTREFLYVGVFSLGGPSNLVLVMKNCYATPTNNVNDPLKYYFIQDSCPNLQDGTVSVPQNGVSNKGRFSVQMFKFIGYYDKVYLHCAVTLCDTNYGSCRPVCSKAGSPSDGIGISKIIDYSGLITIGPITASGPFFTTSVTTPRPFSTTTITTPRPFSTTTITTPRPFSTTSATTPRPFSTTSTTTPRPFSTTSATTPQPSSSTTTSASPQPCKADAEWQLRGGRSGCFCKDPYKVTALSQVVPEKTCGAFEMTAAFHKCQFNDLSIYFNKTHVKDTACYDFQDDPATNTFTILAPLKFGSCAVEETNDTHITYKTVITIDVETTLSYKTLTATLQCSHKLDMIISLNTVPYPILSTITITVSGKGQFQVYMALYKDSNYQTPYTGSEVALSTREFLYVGVFFLGGSSNFVLVMKNCYATPTNDANDSSKYHIIQNSCKTKADGTVSVVENGVSSKGRFSVQMFKFHGNSNRVYLHCAVSLCDSSTGSCAPVCARAGSLSDGTRAPQSHDGALKVGPIVLSGASSSIITSSHIFWTLLIPALTLLIQSL